MAKKKTTYDLALNWAANRDERFLGAIDRAARLRRVRWTVVRNGHTDRFRRRVDRGELDVRLFLNTQADGANPNSPGMLLCRSLKANGTFVVEDPDDAFFYADRAMQFRYLSRAGVRVPPHVLIKRGQRDKPALTAAERRSVGPTWTAVPAVGMSRSRVLTSGARNVATALNRAGFPPGQKVLIFKHHKPISRAGHEGHFWIWHLFGNVVPAAWLRGSRRPALICYDDWITDGLLELVRLTRRIAQVTGLDWFLTEIVATRLGRSAQFVVVEPANALAGLGPGSKPVAAVPNPVLDIAATALVEAAWRYAHDLPTAEGLTIHFAE
jgi:hypothetical protein